MTINNIIDQNDQTLACLVVNDYCRAIESSSRALAYLQEATSSRMLLPEPEERRADGTESSSSSSLSITESLDESMILLLQAEEGLPTPTPTSGSLIYNQGIPIPPAVSRDQGMVTSILIFNSALAHHLAAETPTIPTTIETIQKAKRLYELASNVDRIVDSVCFQFAVINNMGVVERKLGNTSLSNEYFDYLASLAEHAKNNDDQA